MNISLYVPREGGPPCHAAVPDAGHGFGYRLSAEGSAVVRLLVAAAVASLHMVPAAPARAQEAKNAPKVISGECFEILTNDADHAIIKLRRGKLQSEIGGEPVVLLPALCLTGTATAANSAANNAANGNDGGVAARPKEDYDATAMRKMLAELLKYLKEQGVPAENVTDPEHGVDGVIDRNRNRPDVREPLLRAAEQDNGTTAGLLGILTAGCVALTGGAACAVLPALFGNLFKGQVTKEVIEGAARVADKIAKGQTLDDSDYSLLKDIGAKEWATKALSALQTGKYEDFVAAVGQNNAVPADQISLLKKLARLADTDVISCATISKAVGSPVTIDTRTRRVVDEMIFRSQRNLSAKARDELKSCLDAAFTGGG